MRVDRLTRASHSCNNPSPVSICAEYSRLHKAGADDSLRNGTCRLFTYRARHRYFNQLRRAFAITGNRLRQHLAHISESISKVFPVRVLLAELLMGNQTASHRHQHIIRACVPIHSNHVEGLVGCLLQQAM
ncbi:hypothetical protein D1872_286430 [compost metagenome]